MSVETYNAADVFVDRHVREGRGQATAIVDADEGRHYSYAELATGVARLAHALGSELEVRPEERVVLLLLDSPAFALGFFAAIKVGAVAVPVSTLQKPADYASLLEHCRARVVIVSSELQGLLIPVLGELRHLRHLVVVGDAPSLPLGAVRCHSFDALLARPEALTAPFPTRIDDACFWLYSSGTTGSPKAAVHRQGDMEYCARHYAEGVLGIGPSDRTFSVAKLFFAYGLGNALYFPFWVGATTILHRQRPTPKRSLEIVAAHGATLFFAVPTAYAGILALDDAATRSCDLRAVRCAVSAGEALPAALYERWRERFGVELLDGIGSTEALHIFISNRVGRVRPGTSGTPVPGYRARILDDAGAELPPGEVGDLWVSGESLCSGYFNDRQGTLRTFVGEWARTGDKYVCDAEGHFVYQGRSDDMLKSGGIWVSPVEVEAALVAHPAVLESGVVAQCDEHGLDKPAAFVVLRPGHVAGPELAQALREFVKQRIAHYKCPRWVWFVDELPKTATGKIQRYKLRAQGAPRVGADAAGGQKVA